MKLFQVRFEVICLMMKFEENEISRFRLENYWKCSEFVDSTTFSDFWDFVGNSTYFQWNTVLFCDTIFDWFCNQHIWDIVECHVSPWWNVQGWIDNHDDCPYALICVCTHHRLWLRESLWLREVKKLLKISTCWHDGYHYFRRFQLKMLTSQANMWWFSTVP